MYWKNQIILDVLIAVILAAGLTYAPKWGIELFDSVDSLTIVLSARMWVAPALTLLGMLCATTAFVFSAIDRPEFVPLRKSKSESQLWMVFSEAILWLSFAALFAIFLSLIDPDQIGLLLRAVSLSILFLVSIAVMKFAWVMRQIISVRVAQSAEK
jgi:hypothetical protein